MSNIPVDTHTQPHTHTHTHNHTHTHAHTHRHTEHWCIFNSLNEKWRGLVGGIKWISEQVTPENFKHVFFDVCLLNVALNKQNMIGALLQQAWLEWSPVSLFRQISSSVKWMFNVAKNISKLSCPVPPVFHTVRNFFFIRIRIWSLFAQKIENRIFLGKTLIVIFDQICRFV